MLKIRIAIAAALLSASFVAFAQETPSWIRKNAISPDGKTVAFSYKGDIFTVASTGGQARQITSHNAYESDPVWSPDGKALVFTSAREGSKDLWAFFMESGAIKRLTDLPGNEQPLAVAPDGTVYFSWNGSDMQSPGFDGFPGEPSVWATSLNASAPALVTSLTISAMSIGPGGDILYEDWKGYEDPMRKHHTSSVTRDIWLLRPSAPGKIDANASFTKLSTYKGEDRNPVFAADGNTFYFLRQ